MVNIVNFNMIAYSTVQLFVTIINLSKTTVDMISMLCGIGFLFYLTMLDKGFVRLDDRINRPTAILKN